MTKHKRTHGTGSIYPRDKEDKSKGYIGALQLPGGGARYVSGGTKAEVSNKLDDLRKELGLGLIAPTGKETVAEFATAWLAQVIKPTKAPNTHYLYESVCRIHLLPALGQTPLRKVTAAQIQRLIAAKLDSGCGPSHVSLMRTVLSIMLARAVKWGYVPRNVAEDTVSPRIPESERHPLAPAEFPRFLEAIRGQRFEPLFLLLLGTGLRIGEALGVTWGDVDLTTGRLEVRHQLDSLEGSLRLTPPKRKKSRRIVVIPPFALEPLRDLRRGLLAAGNGPAVGDLLFRRPDGGPVWEGTVRRDLDKACLEKGLPRLTPHDLRRTYASLLATEGVDPKTVQELMGHSSVLMTMDVYAQSHMAAKEDAASRLDRLSRN